MTGVVLFDHVQRRIWSKREEQQIMTRKTLRAASRGRSLVLVATTGVAVMAAACGSSSSKTTSASTAAPATTTAPAATSGASTQASGVSVQLAAEVPAADKGGITVATNATYAPDEFFASNNQTITGWDPDLGHAIGKVLGVKFNFVNTSFASIIPGLQDGKYTIAMSSATINPTRLKQIDFVSDFNAGEAFFVPAASTLVVNAFSDLCGKTVAVETGSVEATDITTANASCTTKMNIESFTNQSEVNLALSSGRADVASADSPVADYQVAQSAGKFKLSGSILNSAPEGIEFPKGSPLEQPILGALKQLIQNGTYQKIMTKYGVASGELLNPQIQTS